MGKIKKKALLITTHALITGGAPALRHDTEGGGVVAHIVR